jgi:alkylation response protein AidB-like acyl-CoA dehydrogenase
MVSRALLRWGSDEQRDTWLPRLAAGDVLASVAITEQEAGSDAGNVDAHIRMSGANRAVLDGEKVWVTGGARAGVFLVLARGESGLVAVLVERDRDGVEVVPRSSQLGLRAAMVADVSFHGCELTPNDIVGGAGFGLAAVVNEALLFGRYSVAHGCVGIARAALESSVHHARNRKQFGVALGEHQLVRRMLTNMAVGVEAARLMARSAGEALDASVADAMERVIMAKYLAARVATDAARDAVQVHGAAGCAAGSVPERLFRDAKVMQIIEGSDEVNQVELCGYLLRRAASQGVDGAS